MRNLQTQILKPDWTLEEFNKKRNQVLVMRETGGLGDILMHRMMFEDFKEIIPEAKIIFACPPQYKTAMEDHPFVDEVVNCQEVNAKNFIASYNTTHACCRYEESVAPAADLHRSDIWASHCGVKLTKHNMHLKLPKQLEEFGKEIVEKIGRPSVAFSPISAMPVKNLLDWQCEGVVKGLRDRGLNVFGLHNKPIPYLEQELNVPVLSGYSILEWMSFINAADYIVSVDSAAFHCAGGFNKPLVGIFTFCDGKVYGKYYDFELVQRHRDNGDWECGPCYKWPLCPFTTDKVKPCLTTLTPQMILKGVDAMLEKRSKTTNLIQQ